MNCQVNVTRIAKVMQEIADDLRDRAAEIERHTQALI